jgi:NADPH-dependent curcumin reductase CurA
MAGNVNRQILLKSRPEGAPGLDNFELVERPIPEPGEGEVLVRTHYLSLDPYMRGRMSAAKSYAKPAAVGEPMVGGTVGEIVASRNPKFSVGDMVLGFGGWQDYALSSGTALRKLDPAVAPVSTALGVLGMPGMTAYVGLLEIGQPKPGETAVVAAASGAVGSVVGQIAKIKGCRAVGIAGGADKCRFVTGELGFDACVDHRAPDFAHALEAASPKGIDVYFENVGGAVQQTVWPLLNDFARIPGLRAHRAVQFADPDARPRHVLGAAQAPPAARVHRVGLRGQARRLPARRRRLGTRGTSQVPRGHRRGVGAGAGRVPRPAARQELRQDAGEGGTVAETQAGETPRHAAVICRPGSAS